MTGKTPAPAWLAIDGILTLFVKRRATARQRYSEFVKRVQREMGIQGDKSSIPRAQRRAPAPTLAKLAAKHHERNDVIYTAYATGAYSYREIAECYSLHLATAGRIIRGKML